LQFLQNLIWFQKAIRVGKDGKNFNFGHRKIIMLPNLRYETAHLFKHMLVYDNDFDLNSVM